MYIEGKRDPHRSGEYLYNDRTNGFNQIIGMNRKNARKHDEIRKNIENESYYEIYEKKNQ